jgi:endonuclease/exonuclease/phosphatase family metal-dependent hydrolase
VSIIAFNILKLRNNLEGTVDMWQRLMNEMSEHDVVALTEVPASEEAYEKRVMWFEDVLNQLCSTEDNPAPWKHVVSKPSHAVSIYDATPEEERTPHTGGSKEVHVVFAKHPVKIVDHWTWTHADYKDKRVALDWAPLSVKLDVKHVQSMPEDTLVLTMVHLPPAQRSDARNEQLSAMLGSYALVTKHCYGSAMTKNDADNMAIERAMHVIAGDFNTFPGATVNGKADGEEVFGLTAGGWAAPVFGALSATSSGCKAYDNILVDEESWKRIEEGADNGLLEMERTVHALKFPQKPDQRGISDHFPVSLTIRDRVLVE